MALPIRRRSEGEVAPAPPLRELDQLNRRLRDYLESWSQLPAPWGEGFIPRADVEETDDAYVVEVELPGVNKKDLSVELAGRRLVVSGQREEKERVGILRTRSRSVGRFHYEVVLPGEVEDTGEQADLDHGVLTVRLPKAVSERARRIAVH